MEYSLSPARHSSSVGSLRRRYVILALAAGMLLLPAVAAQADTKQVSVGPKKPLKGVPPQVFNTDFFPNSVTIAKGDSLNFTWGTGFGDVAFVPKRHVVPPFALPLPDQPIAGAKDAAGADMWFNGRPSLVPNMAVLSPAGGKVVDGSRFVSSGFEMDGPQKPWKVRFPKPGRYELTSVFHPATTLDVVVKKSRKGVPSRRQDRRYLAKQTRSVARKAKRLAAFEGPSGNVVRAGNDAGGSAQIAFFPAKKTVAVGEPVTFAMSKSSIEIHNVAFGPKDYLDGHAKSFLGQVIEPFVAYRSQAPGTALVADGAVHGNGWVNTGVLDTDPGSPFPSRETVTFSKPGTYSFYCAVHGNDMAGEIIVR
jgi:plastocyanin